MIFENPVINKFNYSDVEIITEEVIEQMYNSQIDPRGELFELKEALIGYDISAQDLELILRFYCQTPITTIEEDLRYPILKKEMWSAYHTHGKNSKEYKTLKRELELLDLKLTPEGRQKAIEAVMNKKEVTYFNSLYCNAPIYMTIEEALSEIKSEKHKSLIDKIRKAETKEEKNELKKKLPVILFNGLFYKRHSSTFIKYSNVMCADFDDFKTSADVESAKNKLMKDKHVYSVFASPNLGLKTLIKVHRNSLDDHIQLFEGTKEHFSYVNGFDEACKDIVRSTFLSSALEIHIKPNAEIFDKKVKSNKNKTITTKHKMKPKTTKQIVNELDKETQRGEDSIFNIKDIEQIKKLVLEYWENKYSLAHGSRNNNLFKLAIKLYCAGVPEKSIEDLFFKQFSGVFESDDELNSIVNSACKDDAIFFSQPWVDYKLKRTVISLLEDEEKLNSLLTEKDVNPKDKDVQKELMQLRAENFQFWDIVKDKDGCIKAYKVNEFRLMTFLKRQDIFCLNNDGRFQYYQIKGNIIYDLDGVYEIKKIIIKYIEEKHGSNDKLINVFLKAKSIYSDLFLSDLSIHRIEKNRDTASEIFKCYKNGVLVIKKSAENQFISYQELKYPVHEKQIIQRDFKPQWASVKSDFEVFIRNVSGENYYSFISAIGYLASSYKNHSLAKAVVLNDLNVSFSQAEGGTGKSIFGSAISFFTSLCNIDGKKFSDENKFSLSSVSEDTNVLFIDDIRKNYKIESAYNLITGDCEVEMKNKNRISIPFSDSPKLLLSSNHPIRNSGNSSLRRRFDLIFSNYYLNTTVIEEHKKQLFYEWSEKEWAAFDHYMIQSVKYFLENGLVNMSDKAMRYKNLVSETSEDWISYLSEQKEMLTREYFSLETIKHEYSFHSNNHKLAIRTLKSWLKIYADFFGYCLSEKRISNKRMYRLDKVESILDTFQLKKVA